VKKRSSVRAIAESQQEKGVHLNVSASPVSSGPVVAFLSCLLVVDVSDVNKQAMKRSEISTSQNRRLSGHKSKRHLSGHKRKRQVKMPTRMAQTKRGRKTKRQLQMPTRMSQTKRANSLPQRCHRFVSVFICI
jgi:hypothetical protein